MQKEAATQSVKLQEAIDTHNDTTSILEGPVESNKGELLTHAGDIKKLREAIKAQSVTIGTVQDVRKADSAKIHALEVSLSSIKNANKDLVAECKAAAAKVAQRIPSGDIPWP